jgi:hypothetical protein
VEGGAVVTDDRDAELHASTPTRLFEVPCVDCGADIIEDAELPKSEQRCDVCRDHYAENCDEDCPLICDACREHHFVDHCDQREVAEALLKFDNIYANEIDPTPRPGWLTSAIEAAKRMLGACKVCNELECDHE